MGYKYYIVAITSNMFGPCPYAFMLTFAVCEIIFETWADTLSAGLDNIWGF